MRFKISFLLLVFSISVSAQENTFTETELTLNQHIDGTLLMPNVIEKPNLIILIAGSGPTDRNGNQNFMISNCFKKLAEGLSNKGIATFRYDKRIVKQIREGNIDNNILFDDFVTDGISVINYFRMENTFNKIIILGHSQGSLVGMLAAQKRAHGFISLAGPGKPINEVIVEQITNNAPMFITDTNRIFGILKEGKTTSDFPPALASIFNLDVQPFIINWMQYDPKEVIGKLEIPVLIVNGTQDIQISEAEANLLKEGSPEAELVIIEKMNHVLVPIEGDRLENTKAYNESNRKISSELIPTIINFIKNFD